MHKPKDEPDDLTNAERQVAFDVARSRTNTQIAQRRSTSVSTVQNQVHSILEKLGLANRTALAVYVVQNGLLEETDEQE